MISKDKKEFRAEGLNHSGDQNQIDSSKHTINNGEISFQQGSFLVQGSLIFPE